MNLERSIIFNKRELTQKELSKNNLDYLPFIKFYSSSTISFWPNPSLLPEKYRSRPLDFAGPSRPLSDLNTSGPLSSETSSSSAPIRRRLPTYHEFNSMSKPLDRWNVIFESMGFKKITEEEIESNRKEYEKERLQEIADEMNERLQLQREAEEEREEREKRERSISIMQEIHNKFLEENNLLTIRPFGGYQLHIHEEEGGISHFKYPDGSYSEINSYDAAIGDLFADKLGIHKYLKKE